MFAVAMTATTQDIDAMLSRLFGSDVGLNADWWCSAWKITGGRANREPGTYLLDNEDTTFSIVYRTFGNDGCDAADDIVTIAEGLTLHAAMHQALTIKEAK